MVKLNLTTKQLNRLKNGHNIQLKHGDIGIGADYTNFIHPSVSNQIQKAYMMGKGFRMSPMMAGDGLLSQIKNSVRKAPITKIIKKIRQAPDTIQEIDELGDIKAMLDGGALSIKKGKIRGHLEGVSGLKKGLKLGMKWNKMIFSPLTNPATAIYLATGNYSGAAAGYTADQGNKALQKYGSKQKNTSK